MNSQELLEKIYANPELVFDHLHPDFTLHSPGQGLIAGTFSGAEGMKAHFAKMQELSGGSLKQVRVDNVLADDTWAMVPSRLTGERNGKQLDTWGFGLWRFKDGLLIDHWESVGDQAHWDDFWS